MDSNIILYCPSCNSKLKDKVFNLSCMHSVDENCINSMREGSIFNCKICNTHTGNNDIISNYFFEKMSSFEMLVDQLVNNVINCEFCNPEVKTCVAEKYCAECSIHICNNCLAIHNKIKTSRNHNIDNQNNIDIAIFKSKIIKCEKHDQDLWIYCSDCEKLICSICWMSHANHNKDYTFQHLFELSKKCLQQNLDDIDQILISQENIQLENNKIQTEFINKVEKIEKEISCQVIELKEFIENKSNELITKLYKVKERFLKDLDLNSKDINDYIFSLNNHKSYVKKIIENGTDVDLINLKKDVTKTSLIEFKKPELIPIEYIVHAERLIDVETLQCKSLFGSLQNMKIDGRINKTSEDTSDLDWSFCTMNQDLYSFTYPRIYVYDMLLCKFKTSIDLEKQIPKDYDNFQIIEASNFLFILFDIKITDITNNTDINISLIYKFDVNEEICSEWKSLKLCFISSTNQNTILAVTCYYEIIEFSLEGHQLKFFEVPIKATLLYLAPIYELNDGRYVVGLNDDETILISLLNSRGEVIKSFSIKHKYFTLCTDGDKYIFVSNHVTGIITVLSTELYKIQEFRIPDASDISYDKENIRLVIKTKGKFIYINYY